MRYSFTRRQKERKIERLVKELEKVRWKYKNLILFTFSFFMAYLLLGNKAFGGLLYRLGEVGYLGSFFSGLFYTFSLTVAFSTVIFYEMGKFFNPFLIALIGAFGSLVGDYFIFRFVRDNLVDEIKLLINNTGKKVAQSFERSIFYQLFPFSNLALSERFKRVWFKASYSRKWKFFVGLIGCSIIASPLPDELGIAFLGSIRFDTKKFLLLSYVLNFIGIFFITSLNF